MNPAIATSQDFEAAGLKLFNVIISFLFFSSENNAIFIPSKPAQS